MEAASRLVRDAITLFQTLDPEHYQLAAEWSDLAMIEGAAGRYEDALVASDQALALTEAIMGPDHPNLAFVLNNRGATLQDLGRHEEAIVDLERAHAIHVSSLPADHPMVVGTAANIGIARRELGQLAASLEILTNSTRALRASVGMRHEFTIHGVCELATTCERIGPAAVDEHAVPWLERLIASDEVEDDVRTQARVRLADLRARVRSGTNVVE
jgi:tetratricopeptide (TPR) repeat protein